MSLNKDFNAVKMMREIRDKLSIKFNIMTHEEQKEYIKRRIKIKKAISLA